MVDLVLTDPPYCVSRTHQLGFSNMGRAGMNYGEWDYNFDQKEWIRLTSPVVREGGSMIIFNDWKNLSYVVEALVENGFLIKDLIRWEKTNPMPRNIDSRYVMDFEVAIWAVKGKGKWTFNRPADVPYLKPVFRTGMVPGGKKGFTQPKSTWMLYARLWKFTPTKVIWFSILSLVLVLPVWHVSIQAVNLLERKLTKNITIKLPCDYVYEPHKLPGK